jgi:hypothetical protein
MPMVQRLAHPTLLLVVALVAAGCATAGPSLTASAAVSPAATAPASTGASPSAEASASHSASGAAEPGGTASGDVWLPDWADASVPDEVANRRVLPFCGIERPPAPQPGIFVDRIVRLCFWDAAQNGEEAEWVSIQSTMEGGTIATVYRALRDGTVEVLMDTTQDPFGAGAWIRNTCREVVEAEGDELIGVSECDEGEPLG